ncbi:MAG: adenosylmethionine decarboxylase [Deltaproteobacteria bacterium]|nr:adenosylmethionine decarboxylase [Deltaproteobacteria bacterium]
MQTLGRHALLDLYGCDPAILNDGATLQELLKQTAVELECTVVEEVFHNFSPYGVSGVVVIAESHLAVHTWPEHGFAAVDLFTCNDTTALSLLAEILQERFGASHFEYREEVRGTIPLRMKTNQSTQHENALLPRAEAAT